MAVCGVYYPLGSNTITPSQPRHIMYICVPPTVLIKRVIFVCASGYLCMRACVCMKTFVFQQTAEHKLHIAFSQEIHCRTGCNLPKLYETWHCHHFTTPHNIHTLVQEHTPHPPTQAWHMHIKL